MSPRSSKGWSGRKLPLPPSLPAVMISFVLNEEGGCAEDLPRVGVGLKEGGREGGREGGKEEGSGSVLFLLMNPEKG